MPTPKRTPGDTTRGMVAALWISLGCVIGGCHGVPSLPLSSLPRSPYPCPGCHAAADEPCGCTPDAISAGYHETRWRSIQPLQTFHAGVHLDPDPVHSAARMTKNPEIDVLNPNNGSFSLIAPQSHEEPVSAIAASLDGELARYFFDLDTPPHEAGTTVHEAHAPTAHGRNIARSR